MSSTNILLGELSAMYLVGSCILFVIILLLDKGEPSKIKLSF